jgi:hypothetical protein
MTEPRYTIRTWFDSGGSSKVTAANLKKRDDVNATFEADYEMSETDLKHLFVTADLDIIFVIKKVRTDPIKAGRNTIAYRHFIGIQPVVVNKLVDGSLNVEASELLGKALSEIRRIIKEEIDTGGTLSLSVEQPEIQRLGSTLLHGDTVVISFDQYV